MLPRIKISDWMNEHRIRPHHAAGFLAHLKMSGDDLEWSTTLSREYLQYAGIATPKEQTSFNKTETEKAESAKPEAVRSSTTEKKSVGESAGSAKGNTATGTTAKVLTEKTEKVDDMPFK
jgi:hypothetical protein